MSEHPEQSIWLWPGKLPGSEIEDDFQPRLDIYLADAPAPRGAVVVLPGGGYTHRALHEGEPVARTFNEHGMHAFVVQYRVEPHPPSAAFLDAARGMRLVRSRAAEWGVKPDHIAACGFSAGGHLTGLLGVHFDAGDSSAPDPVERVSNRPDALVLCYAWLSAKYLNQRMSCLPKNGGNTLQTGSLLNATSLQKPHPRFCGTPLRIQRCRSNTACSWPGCFTRTRCLSICTSTKGAATVWGWQRTVPPKMTRMWLPG